MSVLVAVVVALVLYFGGFSTYRLVPGDNTPPGTTLVCLVLVGIGMLFLFVGYSGGYR